MNNDLHSTVVLLKEDAGTSRKQQQDTFTFYCSSIKGAAGPAAGPQMLHLHSTVVLLKGKTAYIRDSRVFIYILLQFY